MTCILHSTKHTAITCTCIASHFFTLMATESFSWKVFRLRLYLPLACNAFGKVHVHVPSSDQYKAAVPLYKGQPTEDCYNKSHKYVPMWPWNSAVCTPWSPVSADQDLQCQHKFHREPSPASSPTPWDPCPPEEYQPLHGTGGRKDTLVHNYMSYEAT